jgi:acyl-CoA thioester hydrolase
LLDKFAQDFHHFPLESTKFRYVLRVAYTHCTIGNHVYYSRYLDFMEIARGELFRVMGATCHDLHNLGLVFPVIETSIKYRKPARYDDLITIELWVSELEKVRLRFACQMTASGVLICEAETLHVCTSLEDRPIRIPTAVTGMLSKYLLPKIL